MASTKLLLLAVMALGFVFSGCSGKRPDNLGVKDGKLAPCPSSPNCVSTFADDKVHGMDPIIFEGDAASAKKRLIEVIKSMPRTKIVTDDDNYIHAEFTSLIWRFVDDVEFIIDGKSNKIHFRSASRLGQSDLGVNRDRMETIKSKFESK